jgi:hypothetical protein
MGCPAGLNTPAFVCDDISIADVVFWDRRLSSQELVNKFQCSGYRFGMSS